MGILLWCWKVNKFPWRSWPFFCGLSYISVLSFLYYSGELVGDPMVNFTTLVRIIAFLLSEVGNSYFCWTWIIDCEGLWENEVTIFMSYLSASPFCIILSCLHIFCAKLLEYSLLTNEISYIESYNYTYEISSKNVFTLCTLKYVLFQVDGVHTYRI